MMPRGGEAFAGMMESLRHFLDIMAGSRPDEATLLELKDTLDAWSARLAGQQVPEADQLYARRSDLPGRGQANWPPVTITRFDENAFAGDVTFGRFFLGKNGMVHGGAVSYLFDEMSGRMAQTHGRPASRITREEGRKRFLRLELRHGETLCAEAEVLMVALKPGQP